MSYQSLRLGDVNVLVFPRYVESGVVLYLVGRILSLFYVNSEFACIFCANLIIIHIRLFGSSLIN